MARQVFDARFEYPSPGEDGKHFGAPGLKRRIQKFDAGVVFFGAGALILLGTLRGAFEAFPLVLFLGALILYMVPGVLLSHWFLGERFPGAASVPLSFAISTGLFGLLGVPMLIFQLRLEIYLWVSGAVLVAFLVVASFSAFRRRPPVESRSGFSGGLYVNLLWVPFLVSGTALAFASRARIPGFYNDWWVYVAYVRELMNTHDLGRYEPYFGTETGISRLKINGWLLEQAAFSRLSGIDPVNLVLQYLGPTTVLVSLLAFYALVRVLLKSETAALLIGSLYALFLLITLRSPLFDFGSEFVTRIVDDKLTARFVFLPVALAVAVVYLKSKELRYLAVFAFLCWAMMAVHPVGLAITGISMTGFALFYLAFNWRKRGAWARISGLGLAGASALLGPALFVLALGESLTDVLKDADINAGDPDVLANMVFARPERKRIFELADGSYIMHPSLLMEPLVLAAFFLGGPFLIRRLKSTLAARLLLGMLLAATAVCYIPPIATFVGNQIIVPGQLWRLAWPIPLAAFLIVGWMAWEATHRAQLVLNRARGLRRLAGLLPLALVAAVMAMAAPTAVAGVKDSYRAYEVARSGGSCFDPILPWMRDNVAEPSIVLAPDAFNTCIPAYSARADVVSFRGGLVLSVLPALERRAPGQIEVPQSALDVRKFFSGRLSVEEATRILQRYEVDYVLVPADSPLNEPLKGLPGFAVVDTPGERYTLYTVDRDELGG